MIAVTRPSIINILASVTSFSGSNMLLSLSLLLLLLLELFSFMVVVGESHEEVLVAVLRCD